MMHPFNEFILKIASGCNLNCDYCYEYNLGDDSWKKMPAYFSNELAEILVKKIINHSKSKDLDRVNISFHGGEPLLIGEKKLSELCRTFYKIEKEGIEVDLTMQTNGTLISKETAKVFKKNNIFVAISIDGPKIVNDLHRLDHKGQSTFESTMRGINILKDNTPELLSGLLSVIDISSDPLEVFDFIASLEVERVDFLKPHYNWNTPPPRVNKIKDKNVNPDTCYGEWFGLIWDSWFNGRHSWMQIRFFENIIRSFMGGRALYEEMTLEPATLLTIASNGNIEGVDTLKSTAANSQHTGLNIINCELDDCYNSEIISSRQSGKEDLCTTCNECKHLKQCAGGYFPHRFSKNNNFDNTSIYCNDLYWILDKIQNDIKL